MVINHLLTGMIFQVGGGFKGFFKDILSHMKPYEVLFRSEVSAFLKNLVYLDLRIDV